MPRPAVLIGVAMGGLGFAVDWAVVEVNNLKFSGTPGRSPSPQLHGYSVFLPVPSQMQAYLPPAPCPLIPQQCLNCMARLEVRACTHDMVGADNP